MNRVLETPEIPPRPPSRPWRHLLRGLLALLLIPGTVLAGAELATPPVAGAPALVAAIDRAHGSAPVPAEPSWRVSEAIVAAEDGSFYSNDGIDAAALVRALWGWFIGVDHGGSTITEQLAKVLYTGGRTGIADRVAQVALALKLDGHYTKPAILSMYLSAIYFGNGYYGVLAASEGYFGLAPDRLSWAQASLLAGLPQAPSLLDPLQNLALARHRQSYVLDRLVATGVLTRAQAASAAAAPLDLR
jgi:membrane peptidoglycan carboxypeptidase